MPVFSYGWQGEKRELRVIRCADWQCTQHSDNTVSELHGSWQGPSMAIGPDGLPIMAYRNGNIISVAKDPHQTSPVVTEPDWTSRLRRAGGIAIWASLLLGLRQSARRTRGDRQGRLGAGGIESGRSDWCDHLDAEGLGAGGLLLVVGDDPVEFVLEFQGGCQVERVEAAQRFGLEGGGSLED